jgi:hypothetical protein
MGERRCAQQVPILEELEAEIPAAARSLLAPTLQLTYFHVIDLLMIGEAVKALPWHL